MWWEESSEGTLEVNGKNVEWEGDKRGVESRVSAAAGACRAEMAEEEHSQDCERGSK